MSKDLAKIKAGTGETLLALATALGLRFKYRQIFLARPYCTFEQSRSWIHITMEKRERSEMAELASNLL
jgi:predicted ribonuclease YlaK